jgi:hypothetical protein
MVEFITIKAWSFECHIFTVREEIGMPDAIIAICPPRRT